MGVGCGKVNVFLLTYDLNPFENIANFTSVFVSAIRATWLEYKIKKAIKKKRPQSETHTTLNFLNVFILYALSFSMKKKQNNVVKNKIEN